jgi:hypothetical protein
MIQKYLDDLLEVSTIKEGDEYALGYYNNKVATSGLYLKAKKDSILERVEIMAKGKFKLEKDSENYAQEVRTVFFEKLADYLSEHGEPITDREVDNMNGYLYTSCANYMSNVAKAMKSGSSSYDSTTREFTVVELLSLDVDYNQALQKDIEESLENYSKESYCAFREWFNDNKKRILTRKQLEYLEDENVVLPNNRAQINKIIAKRVYLNYTDESLVKHKTDELDRKIKILNDIINSKTSNKLIQELKNHLHDELWLVERVYSLSTDTCKVITKAYLKEECDSLHNDSSIEEIKEDLIKFREYLIEKIN